MKNENYYLGLDIGTNSVGYAVTDEQYNLCKFKGEPMWGATLFDTAEHASVRRTARTARRRLDRRQGRIKLLMDLFATEISKIDDGFFKRIKESYLYPENDEQKVRIFGSYKEQKAYTNNYPTIHHLIVKLMNSNQSHDARLVYLACAWLVAHRGHFLSDVDKRSVDAVTDFKVVYQNLVNFIKHDEYALPWSESIQIEKIENALKIKLGITKKIKMLTEVLFGGGKAPKNVDEEHEYNYELVIKLLCGGKASLKDLFGKDEYDELEEKSIALNMNDEKLVVIMQSLGDDAEFIAVLKSIYDWSILVDALKEKKTISEAKVEIYNQHKNDLKLLKKFVKKYIPNSYNDIFRSEKKANNYVAYIGKNQTNNKDVKIEKAKSKEDFCKYISSIVKSITPDEVDKAEFEYMMSRLESNDFLPKQVDNNNRVIPYQLYWHELNKILENAKEYIPFLSEADEDGITGAQKVMSVFEFRVPYYVGPLKEKSNPKLNHWMVRKSEGRIYPWNFNDKVDLDASEDAFIARMTNSCTYLPGEDVLPKCSLLYSAFEVLNEINNIKIDEIPIPVSLKQEIYENIFMQYDKVTVKHIKDYLEANNYVKKGEYSLSGLDISVKSSLKSFRAFRNLIKNGLLSYSDVEKIISRATYSEDKIRYTKWLCENFSNLPESERKYISGLKFKEFGRLSRKLLCGINGVNKKTGEVFSIIRAMWETNCNFMELCSNKFTFTEEIEKISKEYYDTSKKTVSERLDDMYISNATKRAIIRTLDVVKDVVKVQGNAPKTVFIEMARGEKEDKKGKRTNSRLERLNEFYKEVDGEDVRILKDKLEEWGESAHNKLQSDKLFLYFIQLGKCLYTGKSINIESVIAGNGEYNIEHIYPRCFVKDDSVVNNKILVDSKVNGEKSDSYPISAEIQENMFGLWTRLNKHGLLSDEKFKRLTRKTPFTEEEKFEFVNRQLVETRQSTKVLAILLKELYPNTQIVYVKANLTSDFRKKFEFTKTRCVNDLHHAKDAYLNIVVGNVWNHKFSRKFWNSENDNNSKHEIVFTRPLTVDGEKIWLGAEDKNKVLKIAKKNTARVTMYSFYKHSGQNGGFFDQMPLKAKENLIPLKKNMPTEIYGGYDSATVAGFFLAKYTLGKKTEISFVPVRLLDMERFMSDSNFVLEYASKELGEKAQNIEILFNNRIFKIYTMISLDGARFVIRGKAGLGDIGLMNMMQFKTSFEVESYLKKLEKLDEKHTENENIVWDEMYDGVSKEKNVKLYEHYVEKMTAWPYNKRPGVSVLVEKLQKHSSDFASLDIFNQIKVLLQLQGIFGRVKQADLKYLGESSSSGIAKMSMNISNLKKKYSDVRIIDQSASGLFETTSVNILELL